MTEIKRRIGGTDIGAIMGIHPHSRPIDAYSRIREGVYLKGDTSAMKRGRILEGTLRSVFAEEYGGLQPNGYGQYILAIRPDGQTVVGNQDYEFMSASLDDLAVIDGQPIVVEYKTAGIRGIQDFGADGTDEVPAHYRAQCQWYMTCTKRHKAVIFALVAGDFRTYWIDHDKGLENMLLTTAAAFWKNHILPGVPPPADDSEQYSKWLAGKDREGEVQADITHEAAFRHYLATKERFDAAEGELKSAKNKLISSLGAAEAMAGNGWGLTYKKQARTTVDWETIARKLGATKEMELEHSKKSEFRVLRTKEAK